jgi:glycosyltransferase involved in cell wall biosynthesis
VGQPFTRESLLRLNRLAVRTAWFMLDTIPWDCLYLRTPDLDALWRHVFEHGDAIIYNSEFTRRQFASRFRSSGTPRHLVSPHSLDPTEYLPAGRQAGLQGDHVLVVGNKFAHKYVEPTVNALVAAAPQERFVCLGLESHPHPMVACHTSGHLPDSEIESLYERSSLVVFPSHYEGFGFPLLKGLAYRKPVLMRDGEMARETKQLLGNSPNIVLFRDTAELATLMAGPRPQWQSQPELRGVQRWADSADEVAELLAELISEPNAFESVSDRLENIVSAGGSPAHHDDAVGTGGQLPQLPPRLLRLATFIQSRPAIKALLRPLWRFIFH